ncbi:perilipin-1 isoform X2 [Colossoma macropomum]|uniref:perilipin-1 isoform X2 n=1 Tax=Colossoma macropomum TaxID=42526 RepID=UPI001864D1E8|nr:perilipin-1 isoform X2 [Colossoma macropomum]
MPWQNVFARLRNLPSVNITFEVIGRSYSSAKAANPFLSSVCGVCEEGMRSAGSLAARSVQPAVHMLQPQLVAANSLACRGLDRLEEKMPALDFPPAKLAAGIGDLVSSAVQSPAVQYVLSSKISQMAEEGADTALTFTERVVNYILPATSEEKEEAALEVQKSNVGTAGTKPGFRRLGALASTVWRRAYGQTASWLQQTKSQGQQLAVHIPSVNPPRDGDLGKQLQKAYVSVVAGAKNASHASIDLAKDGAIVLLESLATARRKVLDSITYYGPLPGQSSKPKEEILYNGEEGEKAEETRSQSNGSPAVESNGSDQRNNPSHNSQESVKDGESVASSIQSRS